MGRLLLGLAAITLVLLSAPNAYAGNIPPTACTVVSDSTLEPGQTVTARADGSDAGSPVTFAFDGVVVGTVTTDANGQASIEFTVPAGTTPGINAITVTCVNNGQTEVLGTTVSVLGATATPPPRAAPASGGGTALPIIGGNSLPMAQLGAVLVGGGGLVVLVGRKRRLRRLVVSA